MMIIVISCTTIVYKQYTSKLPVLQMFTSNIQQSSLYYKCLQAIYNKVACITSVYKNDHVNQEIKSWGGKNVEK